jgi:hypothetical protein
MAALTGHWRIDDGAVFATRDGRARDPRAAISTEFLARRDRRATRGTNRVKRCAFDAALIRRFVLPQC